MPQRKQRADGVVVAVGRIVVSRTVPEDAFQSRSPGNIVPGVPSDGRHKPSLNILIDAAPEGLFSELVGSFEFHIPSSDNPVALFDEVLAFPASTDGVPVSVDSIEPVVVFVEPEPVQVELLVFHALPR